ncbi:MAG: OsmC family protein, partial [Candidatus Rokuibacteriota bacterium]
MADLIVTVSRVQETTTSEGAIREHRVLVDRPTDKGGHDRGPMGGELLLAALGGCFMSNLIAAAHARTVTVEGLAVVVRGSLASAPPRFASIEMEVQGRASDPET